MTVVKVGGSLLDWPELPARLGAWLASRKNERLVLVVGGGGAADWIRELDRIHNLGPERSHDLAVRSLELTARVLETLLPGLKVVEEISDLERTWEAGLVPILTPRRMLEVDEMDPLPHSWDVTSDSIAARLAVQLRAEELVLLKRVDLPDGADREEAARLGIVDPWFPVASKPLRNVVVVNLRNARDELGHSISVD